MLVEYASPRMAHIVMRGSRIYHCPAPNVACPGFKVHVEEHQNGITRFGVDWVEDSATEWVILDIDDKQHLGLDVEAMATFFHRVGLRPSLWRSKSGGIHAYIRLSQRVGVASAWQWASRIRSAMRTTMGLAVDAFPSPRRCIFIERFGGVDNSIVVTDETIHPQAMALAVQALPGRPSSDTTRSGNDFRALARILRKAPWNLDKELRDQYIAHTAAKFLPQAVRLADMSPVEPPPVIVTIPTVDGWVRLRPGLAVVSGAPGAGKSTLCWQNAPEGALIISAEYDETGANLLWRKWAPGRDLWFAYAGSAAEAAHLMLNRDAHTAYILDSVQSFTRDFAELDDFIRFLRWFATEKQKLVMLIAHENSGLGRENVHRIWGSLPLRQLSDVILRVEWFREVNTRRVIIVKDRWGFVDEP